MTWETSTMRAWLNGLAANQGSGYSAINYADNNFLDNAFSAKEQTAIADTDEPDRKSGRNLQCEATRRRAGDRARIKRINISITEIKVRDITNIKRKYQKNMRK